MDNVRDQILVALWNRDTKTAARLLQSARYDIQSRLAELDELERLGEQPPQEPPQCP